MQRKTIDRRDCGWGEAPHPLLPLSLRRRWGGETLPDWLCRDLGLAAQSTYEALDSSIWRPGRTVSPRTLNVLASLVRSRIVEVAETPLVDHTLRHDWVTLDGVHLSTRSRNALSSAGLLGRPQDLSHFTFGQLLRLPALGARSALEIACLMESSMKSRTEALAQLGEIADSGQAPDWVSALAAAANQPWATSISERDARFHDMLPSDETGTIQERVERILESPDSILSLVHGPHLLRVIEAIERAVVRLDNLALDEALVELLVSSRRKRLKHVEALLVRFGWSGEAPKTLDETGKGLGVTRERIRQIESRFVQDLPERVYLPQLDAAIELLESKAPIACNLVPTVLIENSIVRGQFTAEAVIVAATLLKRETNLRIEELPGRGEFVVGSKSSVRQIAARARKLAGMSGVTSVHQIVSGARYKDDEVRRTLKGLSHVEFLTEDWFWVTDIPNRRNRLNNVARKILSVAQPQSIQSIREGIRRQYTYRAKSHMRYEGLITPPSDVLAAFFRQSPDYLLQNGEVRSVRPLSYVDELGEVDRTLVDVFRGTATGVLDRRAIVEACVKKGMNENSVSLFLSYSPIMEHVGIDVWKLRGVVVDPVAIEALREANASAIPERRLLSFGWTPNGRLWIAARLPYFLYSMVLGVPGPTKRYLTESRFSARDKLAGTLCGQIVINDQGTSFGYGTFLRTAGAEPGDVLMIEFDLPENLAYLSLTDEVALEGDSWESRLQS